MQAASAVGRQLETMGCVCSSDESDRDWDSFVKSDQEQRLLRPSRDVSDAGNSSDQWSGSQSSSQPPGFSQYIDADEFKHRYTMHECVGAGKTANVHRVVDRKTGTELACKVMQKERNCPVMCFCPMHIKVREEVSALKTLDHPHIMKVVDVMETTSNIFIITDLCRGRELFDNIAERGHFTEADAADVVRRLASALEYMHRRGVAHRDLKPENVMFSDADENMDSLKIIDFGFSRSFLSDDSREVKKSMNTMLGSRGYVAPEVTSGHAYTQAVDLWSLGIVTYTLLCGYLPFRQDSEYFRRREPPKFKLVFPRREWALVSTAAKDLCKRLLIEDPSRRFTAAQCLQHEWLQTPLDAAASDDEFEVTGEGLSTVEILRQPADLTGDRESMGSSVARTLKHLEGSEESSPARRGGTARVGGTRGAVTVGGAGMFGKGKKKKRSNSKGKKGSSVS